MSTEPAGRNGWHRLPHLDDRDIDDDLARLIAYRSSAMRRCDCLSQGGAWRHDDDPSTIRFEMVHQPWCRSLRTGDPYDQPYSVRVVVHHRSRKEASR